MSDEKDHLGSKLHDREKVEEDRYFQEQSRKQIEKLRAEHAKSTAAGLATCPRCGAALEVRERNGVALDTCPKEHGVWVDMPELESITKHEGDGWFSRLLFGRRR
jgi:hypothetical protein